MDLLLQIRGQDVLIVGVHGLTRVHGLAGDGGLQAARRRDGDGGEIQHCDDTRTFDCIRCREAYDRTRLFACFDDITVCALAWVATGEHRYARHGAELVRAWFLTPETRMNPHLTYAQVRLGHDGGIGQCYGIIDFRNLHYLLDAVRLLGRSGEMTAVEIAGLRVWLSEYRGWLVDSVPGRKEAARVNNHGVFYDLQLGAVAAFLGDVATLNRVFRRFRERTPVHFTPQGAQPHEIRRTEPLHYMCFNLQAWVGLAVLAERCGVRLWDYATPDGRSLRIALEALLSEPSSTEVCGKIACARAPPRASTSVTLAALSCA